MTRMDKQKYPLNFCHRRRTSYCLSMDPSTHHQPSKNLQWTNTSRRRHAQRIPAEQWERQREEIDQMYKEQTLEGVMSNMADQHDFKPTKRQYVHQLEKWKIHKYSRKDLVNEELSEKGYGTISSHLTANQNVMLARHTESQGEEEDCVADSDGSVAKSTSNDALQNGHASSSVQSRLAIPVLDRLRAAADFLFAMSDDRASFKLYRDVYGMSSGTTSVTTESSKFSLAICCARSAKTLNDAKEARTILHELDRQETSVDGCQPRVAFLKRTLDIYVCYRTGEKDRARELAQEFVNGDIDGTLAQSSRPAYSTDLLAHQFRRFLLGVCGQHVSDSDRWPLNEDGFPQHDQEFHLDSTTCSAAHQDPMLPVIRQCLDWCADELRQQPQIPAQLRDIPCSSETRTWKENYQLFGCLWSQLHIGRSIGGFWDQTAEKQLGISPTELLVTICWLIMETESEGDNIVRRALNGAEVLQELDDVELWQDFLAKFEWMNNLVELPDVDKEFKAATLRPIREYTQSVLSIDLELE